MSMDFYSDLSMTDSNVMHVSNLNGYSIQRVLGLEADYSGSIDPIDLLDRINHVELVVERYFDRLRAIAEEAHKWDTEVTWA